MDIYTQNVKKFLDQRFKMVNEQGIYQAHQPIYGFRKGHCESAMVIRYSITYQIMQALSHLKFTSLLDIGGAEGYKAALARSIFDVDVRSVDLSGEACKRAKEIFNVDGESVDIHQLPYNDNEFDVVLCSETLEHVPDIQRATKELIRVCRKAVIITVPHESKEVIEKNIRENIPHAHIHSLDTDAFDFILPIIPKIITRRYHNPIFKKVSIIADALKIETGGYSKFLVKIYNSFLPLFKLVFGKHSVGILIKIDDFISNFIPSYSGLIFILLKDASCYSAYPENQISVPQIMDFTVPYFYPRGSSEL